MGMLRPVRWVAVVVVVQSDVGVDPFRAAEDYPADTGSGQIAHHVEQPELLQHGHGFAREGVSADFIPRKPVLVQKQGFEALAPGVKCRCRPGGTGSDDDEVVDLFFRSPHFLS